MGDAFWLCVFLVSRQRSGPLLSPHPAWKLQDVSFLSACFHMSALPSPLKPHPHLPSYSLGLPPPPPLGPACLAEFTVRVLLMVCSIREPPLS